MVSTIPDLKQWVKALAEGKFLSDDMEAERLKLVGGFYGFCLMKEGDWVGHSGSIYGYNTIAIPGTSTFEVFRCVCYGIVKVNGFGLISKFLK
jgi:hypothetical protein